MWDDVADRREGCPGPEILKAYSLGDLPRGVLEAVVRHTRGCAYCETWLDQLADAGDRFVRNIRRHAPARRGETVRGLSPIPPRRFGGFELEELLGEGTAGAVYRARQDAPPGVVAVKWASPALRNPDAGTRLTGEFEATARLKHPNVVEVYRYGEHEGRPYFSMEFLGGGTLERKRGGGPFPDREAAGTVRTLALAVQQAHDGRIVHWRLKSASVLLGADGTVKLTGFGLEPPPDAAVGAASPLPGPAGGARPVGAGADVHGLGAILHECLTGGPPGWGEDRLGAAGRTAAPGRPARRRHLEAVCRRCLDRDPGRRYATARALAEDLGRWLGGERPEAAAGL